MPEKRTIAVFGTDISQGEAVARFLARDKDIQVRAITSDVTSQMSLSMKNEGVELCECSFKDVDDICAAIADVEECFVLTNTDISDPFCVENEIKLGRRIADACAMSNIGHIVFSTQVHTQRVKGVQVRQWVTKAEIEDYMKEKNLPLTCIMVPFVYQDFFGVLKPEKVQNNTYQLEIPMGLTPIDLISVDDIGGIVKSIFDNKSQYINKTISISGDKLTIAEVAAILNINMKPKMFREKQISINDYRQKEFPGSRDWANIFNFLLRVDTQYNVSKTKTIYPNVKSFQEWVKENGAWILSQLS
ncbi:hypothetical protein SNE40_001243 [Patella caerulea]|uniref:NmrA-like family domain-containing protein 1 n=1 Tax=Patella caerulea TaxID=87958 RepID=A0AAN8K6S8_PATCE